MARLKLLLPETFDFSTELKVHIQHINYGGHLGHDSMVSLLHEARMRFLQALSYTELNVAGFGIILADLAVVYKSEVFYGETLTIEIAVTEFNRYGCDLVYRVSHQNTKKEAAQAKTGIVFFDYQLRKPVAVPAAFKLQFTHPLTTE